MSIEIIKQITSMNTKWKYSDQIELRYFTLCKMLCKYIENGVWNIVSGVFIWRYHNVLV